MTLLLLALSMRLIAPLMALAVLELSIRLLVAPANGAADAIVVDAIDHPPMTLL
jgi:hypothetical protein